MIDAFGRTISYLRLSVTDRCNLRCVYCMGEDAELLPHSEVLRIEELARLARCFMHLGVEKIRITGGEPLVRKGVMDLVAQLGEQLGQGCFSELTMTTNGVGLAKAAGQLYAAGMRRVNVSLDSLDPDLFHRITRRGEVGRVLNGIAAAAEAGLRVKLNAVVLNGINEGGIDALIAWAGFHGHDLTLIEAMPLGALAGQPADRFLSLTALQRTLSARWTLLPSLHATGGPARYFSVAETGGTLGFISPLSHGFCQSCNRIRVSSTGRMTLCLGQDTGLELRDLMRSTTNDRKIEQTILAGIARKPIGHHLGVGVAHAALAANQWNTMNRTGG